MTAVALYAFTCGGVNLPMANFLDGEPGTVHAPVPAYLIDHPQGRVLFDTGLNVAIRQDKKKLLGPLADSQDIDFPDGADIGTQLAGLGIAPRTIRYIVNSHLHYDHCGGNGLFPGATVLVQKREWRAAQNEKTRAAGIYSPLDFEHGQEIVQVDGEHDLYGDGTLVLFPTFGHTPGHQSLRVKLASGTIVLAADCCYVRRTLEHLHMPNSAYRMDQARESVLALRALRDQGARIFFGHDEEFWKTVPKAPDPIL